MPDLQSSNYSVTYGKCVEMAKLKHPDTHMADLGVYVRVMRVWSAGDRCVASESAAPLILPPLYEPPPAPDFLGNEARLSLSLSHEKTDSAGGLNRLAGRESLSFLSAFSRDRSILGFSKISIATVSFERNFSSKVDVLER